MSDSLYNIQLRRLDGTASTLAEYRDRVMLIVNVASKCGLTPQYTALQRLHTVYADRESALG
jgi:glutathione peroxidase